MELRRSPGSFRRKESESPTAPSASICGKWESASNGSRPGSPQPLITLFSRIYRSITISSIDLSELVKEKTLDYSVGQNGCELSGGQCQKIILARAMLSQAPILLLDEPENNLDSDAKTILLNLITYEYANKTVIMISHNDGLLSHMNVICTLGENS